MAKNPNQTDQTLRSFPTLVDSRLWVPSRQFGSNLSDLANNNLLLRLKGRLPPVKVLPPASAPTDPSGKNGIPRKLLSIDATESPTVSKGQKDRSMSEVSIDFQYDVSDPAFASVRFWAIGYKGNTNPVLLPADTTQSPVSFLLETTKEVITIYGQTVSPSGDTAPYQFAKSCTVALDGVVSAPPAPSISQSLVGTPLGYQFAFNQVDVGSTQDVISAYRVYRNITNTSSTASLIQPIVHDPTHLGAVTVTDHIHASLGLSYYYWVSAVNTAGLESTKTAAQSSAVIGSIGSTPVTLSTAFRITMTSTTGTITTTPGSFFTRADGTTQQVGATSQAITGLSAGNTTFAFPNWDEASGTLKYVTGTDFTIPNITGVSLTSGSSQYISTATGAACPTTFTVEMWFKGTAAGGLFDFSAPQVIGVGTFIGCQCQITSAGECKFSVWGGASWANLTTSGASLLDGTWHHIMVSYTTTGTYAQIDVDGVYTNDNVTLWQSSAMGTMPNTTGYWHFGACQGLAGAPLVANTFLTGTIARVALYNTALNYANALSHLQAYTNLGETVYDQEITADVAVNYWELDEPSGSTAADTVGSNTGTYQNAPTLNQTSASITVQGTPQIAWPYNAIFAIQLQTLRNRVGLSTGGLRMVTPASGTTTTSGGGSSGGIGAGTGGGGRGGGCFTANTKVTTLEHGDIPISEVQPGDHCFTAAMNWKPVLALVEHEAEWRTLHSMDNGEWTTPEHKFMTEEGWVRGDSLFPNNRKFYEPVYTLSMDSNEPAERAWLPGTERSFKLANGWLVTNVMIIKSY
jgi:hypothetical protein